MRHLKVLLSALALVLAATACGGDDSTDDTEAVGAGNGVEETDNGDNGGENGNGDDDGNGDDNGEQAAPSGEHAEFCGLAEELETMQAEQDLDDYEERFQDLVEAAPDEIADDVVTMREYFERLEDLGESDDPAAIEESFAILEEPGFIEAFEATDQFLVDECGFEPAMVETGDVGDASEPEAGD